MPSDRSDDLYPPLIRLGRGAWAFVGIVVAVAIVVTALATVSSVVLPLAFASVLAVIFRPLAGRMERAGVPAGLASGLVVAMLLLVAAGVVLMTVRGIVTQSDSLLDEFDKALVELNIDEAKIAEAREAVENASPSVTSGVSKAVVSGLSAVGTFLAGSILAILIMFYLVKDGPMLRGRLADKLPPDRALQFNLFVTESCFVLRRYWLGRSIVSAVVATVVGVAAAILGVPLVLTIVAVTFIGGYIPYIGAVVGGALAVIVALGTEGIPAALIMLGVVLAANLLVENLVEPAVTGRTLDIHPLMVLLVTTAGGIVGGIVGLIMAVPLTVIAIRAYSHLSRVVDVDADAIREALLGPDQADPGPGTDQA